MFHIVTWVRRHFDAYRRRSAWSFVWRITLEGLLISLIASSLIIWLCPNAGRDLDLSPTVFACVVIVIAPIFETLLLQALPIAILRRLRGRMALQVLLTIVPFASLHFLEGIGTGVAAGIICGFYFAFTYAHWANRSHWTAFWTTATSHSLHNAAAFLVLVCSGSLSSYDLEFNSCQSAYGCWYFQTPGGDHVFTIAYPADGSRHALYSGGFDDHVHGPFQLALWDRKHRIAYDPKHRQLSIDYHSYDLMSGSIFCITPNPVSPATPVIRQCPIPIDPGPFRAPFPDGGGIYVLRQLKQYLDSSASAMPSTPAANQ